METSKRTGLTVSILSLSLLTVMAGAAVAPALGVIKANFAGDNPLLVQMIISTPALFILLTNLIFPSLCRVFGTKTLVLGGLALYIIGGCGAGCMNALLPLLGFRALVGIGVGILMPLSTGLLTFYFPPEKLEGLMGYSSAMNQMGGAVATLLSGLLAGISWRASFLVYALGLISVLLCLFCLPNDKLVQRQTEEAVPPQRQVLRENIWFVLSMFLLMITFFLYPANFAITVVAEGILPQSAIAMIMAGMDLIAFAGGLAFVHLKVAMGDKMRFLAPALFLLGYLFLFLFGGWTGAILGSLCIGFANGVGIPYIIATGSRKVGRLATTTIMPLLSMALYGGQFLSPILLSAVRTVTGTSVIYLPYYVGAVAAVLFLLVSRKAVAHHCKPYKKQ